MRDRSGIPAGGGAAEEIERRARPRRSRGHAQKPYRKDSEGFLSSHVLATTAGILVSTEMEKEQEWLSLLPDGGQALFSGGL